MSKITVAQASSHISNVLEPANNWPLFDKTLDLIPSRIFNGETSEEKIKIWEDENQEILKHIMSLTGKEN